MKNCPVSYLRLFCSIVYAQFLSFQDIYLTNSKHTHLSVSVKARLNYHKDIEHRNTGDFQFTRGGGGTRHNSIWVGHKGVSGLGEAIRVSC